MLETVRDALIVAFDGRVKNVFNGVGKRATKMEIQGIMVDVQQSAVGDGEELLEVFVYHAGNEACAPSKSFQSKDLSSVPDLKETVIKFVSEAPSIIPAHAEKLEKEAAARAKADTEAALKADAEFAKPVKVTKKVSLPEPAEQPTQPDQGADS